MILPTASGGLTVSQDVVNTSPNTVPAQSDSSLPADTSRRSVAGCLPEAGLAPPAPTPTLTVTVCSFSSANWMLRLLNLNLGFGSSSAIVTVNFEEVKSFT